jgi:quinol-cytochrome oxidoreductase complex cytochrome b subunit
MGVWSRTRELMRRELVRPVPQTVGVRHILGGMVLFFFLVEVLTGILLMVYYHPTTEEAHGSIQYILSTARFGWLVLGLHRWGADLLILALGLHLLRVFWDGAYRERELNWAIGVALLLLALGFGFTGMLLPWDQQAFWTTEAARRAIEGVPLIGKPFLAFLWGGVELGEGALLRFYVFHVGLFPWITVFFITAHLYFVVRQGLYAPAPSPTAREREITQEVSEHADKAS